MVQTELVMAYMKEHGGITPLEAQNDLGIMRLGARIWDLKHKDGLSIKREMVPVKNRRGDTCIVARYSLEEEEHGRMEHS